MAPHILIGLDLGKVATRIAYTRADSPSFSEADTITIAERHQGRPLDPFFSLYRELGSIAIRSVVATGVYSQRLSPPVVAGLPEEIAQEWAVRLLAPSAGSLNVVRIGGSGFSVLVRTAKGEFRYEKNDRCSAGTGETMERICERLGATLEEAAALALGAAEAIPVTARCSVFAKSELTHFANQGEPHDRLFRGYFESIAKNIHALVQKTGVPGPVWLVGHGALIEPLAAALRTQLSVDNRHPVVEVSPQAAVFEALGALNYARSHEWSRNDWPNDPTELVKEEGRRVRGLAETGVDRNQPRVIRLSVSSEEPVAGDDTPAVLGLDLGSTGSKAALVSVESGDVLADVYRRTDGNPVEAARALVAEVLEKATCPIMAVGLTGSGRDATATVFRAALGDVGFRLLVQNEIVAHAVAAARYDPEGGRSLSVVEIGGQDAKFINVRGGVVTDSDMNRACSAGTGSFLEEQAVLHGVDDIVRFGEIAGRGTHPPDLGQTCTVFVADKAAEALNDGYSMADVFAGFQYSVIRNYKNRVMGNRQFLDRIFFQGKPASSDSLARTLSVVTGREVIVPPNPGAMGAIGIALMVRDALREPDGAQPLDLSALLEARIVERRTFRCSDRNCLNMCRIESAAVDVQGERRRIVSGGSCPKYEAVSASGRKLPKDAPNAFAQRRQLLDEILARHAVPAEDRGPTSVGGSVDGAAHKRVGAPTAVSLGVPCGHYYLDALPFMTGFLAGLGLRPEPLWPDYDTLALGDRRCTSSSVCVPVKLMHGLAETNMKYLLMPVFVTLPRAVDGCGTATCPLTQGTPEMVESALVAEGAKTEVLRPVILKLDNGFGSRQFAAEWLGYWLTKAPTELRRSVGKVRRAYRRGVAAQLEYERALLRIGRSAMEFARREGYPIVLVAGETHVALDTIMHAGIPEVITENGAIAIPVDCYPIPESIPPLSRVHWASAARTLRASVAAARDGDVFPMLIGAYGCGPGSFVEHIFNDILHDHPHTILESDGHEGRAGYVTRVQAFLHAIRAATTGDSGRAAGGAPVAVTPTIDTRIGRYDRFPIRNFRQLLERKVVFGTVGGRLGEAVAAMLRGFGVDAAFSGESGPEVWRLAQEGCTGKECLPYELIWGSFASFLSAQSPDWFTEYERLPLLLSVGLGFQACRANVFHLAEEIAVERMSLPGQVEVSDLTIIMTYPPLTAVAWATAVAVDILNMLRFYHLATEAEPGASARICDYHFGLLLKVLERPLGDSHWVEVRPQLRRIRRVLEKAAAAFATLLQKSNALDELRDVYVCGDIFLRIPEWGNDRLLERLSALGLRVTFEPFAELFELLALRETQDHGVRTEEWWKYHGFLLIMKRILRWLLQAVTPAHPWLEWFDVEEVDRESRRLFCGYPFGESIPTIGGALLAWRTRPIDGVVVVGPRGCGPALISEAQLRRETGIPLLFLYNDGDPIDEARLAGFAWRLRSRPPGRSRRS
ncbi:MAG: hypothetical protein GX604_04210 [Actinobacteria bacterium]|nr:hypothetical protein [Actinomycetota bacterium]